MDGEEPPAYTRAGGLADMLLLGGTFVGMGGLIFTAIGLSMRWQGRELPVPDGSLVPAMMAPLVVIGVSWFAAGRTSMPVLVWASRIAAYLWLMALVALLLRMGE